MLYSLPVPTLRSRTSDARRGAALYIILLVVVLYAALAVGVVRNTGMSAGSLATETGMINIAEIQAALDAYTSEFNRLTLQGCSPTEIYPFAFSPTEMAPVLSTSILNPRCVIYNTVGGNMPFFKPHTGLKDILLSLGIDPSQIDLQITANSQPFAMNFPAIGTNANDITLGYIIGAPGMGSAGQAPMNMCNQINRTAQISFTITDATLSSFNVVSGRNIYNDESALNTPQAPAGLPPAFTGHPYGCMYYGGFFVIYKIIVER